MRYANAKLFLPASEAPAKRQRSTERGTTGAGRTLGRAAHFLLGDLAQLVDKVAVEGTLAAIHVPTYHNTHVGFGVRSSSSNVVKRHFSHTINSALPVEYIEMVTRISNSSFFARNFGACYACRSPASCRFDSGTSWRVSSVVSTRNCNLHSNLSLQLWDCPWALSWARPHQQPAAAAPCPPLGLSPSCPRQVCAAS
jgi:hypothetical protein